MGCLQGVGPCEKPILCTTGLRWAQRPLPSWFSTSLGPSPPDPPDDRRHPFRSRASTTTRSLASPDRGCTTASCQIRKWRSLSRECQPFRGFSLVPSRLFEDDAALGHGFPGGTCDVTAASTPPTRDPSSAKARRDGRQGRHRATSMSPNEERSRSTPAATSTELFVRCQTLFCKFAPPGRKRSAESYLSTIRPHFCGKPRSEAGDRGTRLCRRSRTQTQECPAPPPTTLAAAGRHRRFGRPLRAAPPGRCKEARDAARVRYPAAP